MFVLVLKYRKNVNDIYRLYKRATPLMIFAFLFMVSIGSLSINVYVTLPSSHGSDIILKFLPNVSCTWGSIKGDERSNLYSPCPIPRRPSVAFSRNVSVNMGGWLATPLVNNGIIFLADSHGIYALNESNGDLMWGVEIYDNSIVGRGIGWKALGLYLGVRTYGVGRYVYIGTEGTESRSSKIIALDKLSGETAWVKDLSAESITSNMIVVNEKIYVGTYDGKVICLSEDGKILWSKSVGEYRDAVKGLAYGDGKVHITGGGKISSKLFAVNADDGESVWIYTHDSELSNPIYSDGMIFAVSMGRLVSINENGVFMWEKNLGIGGEVASENSFITVDSLIYVGRMLDENKQLLVVDHSGSVVGNFTLPKDELPSLPVSTENMVILPVRNDKEGYTGLRILWRGTIEIFNMTSPCDECFYPKVSVAYGKVYVVLSIDRAKGIFYKFHDIEKPTIVSIEAPKEVEEGEEFIVRLVAHDEKSAIYRAILLFSTSVNEWNYIDMELERKYFMEPVGGYGFVDEPYIAKLPSYPVGTKVYWYIVVIDNVGNYITTDINSYTVVKTAPSHTTQQTTNVTQVTPYPIYLVISIAIAIISISTAVFILVRRRIV